MTQNPTALHEQALKTASPLKYVVVPLAGDSPIPATFVQANSDELAHVHPADSLRTRPKLTSV